MIGIALRMADCQARARQPESAVKSYQMAGKLASQTGQAQLESVANVNEAQLQAKAGKLDDALRLYQRALELDTSLKDNSASALDWFNYGQFLDESGFSPRLAYACISKSEMIASSLPKSTLPSSASSTREQIEARLGASEAADIRRNLEPTLHDALVFRR